MYTCTCSFGVITSAATTHNPAMNMYKCTGSCGIIISAATTHNRTELWTCIHVLAVVVLLHQQLLLTTQLWTYIHVLAVVELLYQQLLLTTEQSYEHVYMYWQLWYYYISSYYSQPNTAMNMYTCTGSCGVITSAATTHNLTQIWACIHVLAVVVLLYQQLLLTTEQSYEHVYMYWQLCYYISSYYSQPNTAMNMYTCTGVVVLLYQQLLLTTEQSYVHVYMYMYWQLWCYYISSYYLQPNTVRYMYTCTGSCGVITSAATTYNLTQLGTCIHVLAVVALLHQQLILRT
jgi:hypothetical protein